MITEDKLRQIIREEIREQQEETTVSFAGVGTDQHGNRGTVLVFAYESGEKFLPMGDPKLDRLAEAVPQIPRGAERYTHAGGFQAHYLYNRNVVSSKRLQRLIQNSPYVI